ncbi:HAD family hydrolase [uncultured Desulfobacter sp.]|uniref:HAD family hydrolase n=1 Tax=uncultured Desulfobacter sp. TaxID=240139 RepID=UPI002AABBF2B|nr:HAD family hydrolase [uncultured Desulfobacter sp.]
MTEPIQSIQALFFDFDGVLIDSVRTKTKAFEILFQDFSDEIIKAVVSYHTLHGGISRVEKIRYAHENIIKKPLTEKEVMEWANRFSDLVVQEVIRVPWINGAKAFLDAFASKLPVFVISGTPETELKYVVDQRGMSRYFKEILGSPVKKPEHIRKLLAKYSLAPEQCVFIGDALTDYNAARETGLYFIGIQGESHFPDTVKPLPDCQGLEIAIRNICPEF